jgi:hypothetical protein
MWFFAHAMKKQGKGVFEPRRVHAGYLIFSAQYSRIICLVSSGSGM